MLTIPQQIHESDIFGTIIEIGAGNPVSYQLFEVAGASKTVFTALSPYNKKVQSELFFEGKEKDMPRSVSKEFVDHVINQACSSCNFHPDENPDENMMFVSSFQVGDDICNHGWIGYKYKDTYRLYHLTLPNWLRSQTIYELGKVGLEIIMNRNEDMAIPYCDILIEGATDDNPEQELPIQTIANLSSRKFYNDYDIGEQILTFHRNGSMCRLETILREGSDVVPPTIPIYKGSFNPPHSVHMSIAESVSGRFHHRVVFMISLDTYSKAKVDPSEIYKRIQILNRLGYHVIVNRVGFYNDSIKLVQNRTNRNLVWVAGGDTINRLAEMTNPKIDQPVLTADFMVIKRPTVDLTENLPFGNVTVQEVVNETNISSTEIRKMLKKPKKHKDTLREWLSYDPKWIKMSIDEMKIDSLEKGA